MRRITWVAATAAVLGGLLSLVRCIGDSPASVPDAGDAQQLDVTGPTDGGAEAAQPTWCQLNHADARVCDDYDRDLADWASRGWSSQRVDPGAHFDLITDTPESPPKAGRFTTDPVTVPQVYAIDYLGYPQDAGPINRIVLEFSLRVKIHDPGGDSPIITQGFTTASGTRYLVVWLRQNEVAAGTFFGASWVFPSAFLDGDWHTLRIVMQRGDGGIATAITADGQLVTATVGDAGSVNPVSAFIDPTQLEVGMHSFTGIGTRQVDIDNVVVTY